ncbi:MAG: methylmalonyl Co-A mutase-associated GTPase MeaB [Bacillota bacterium]
MEELMGELIKVGRTPANHSQKVLEEIRGGNRRALARALSLVEDREEGYCELLRAAHPLAGRARVVGVTGPAGAGKSTLVDGLIGEYRKRGNTVGVVAVDPSSPFSGGAILGDRIRMESHFLDEGVFIRSLATRGSLGGLSAATGDVIALLDAAGYDVIIVETVGAGQSEVDIMRFAHTVVVVVVPGLGDDVQAIKAGILEIGDVFAVNKADREGADRTVAEIEMVLDMKQNGGWRPPVVRTVATEGKGVGELWKAVEEHGEYLHRTGEYKRRRLEASAAEIEAVLEHMLDSMVIDPARRSGFLKELAEKVLGREMDTYAAAEELLRSYGGTLCRAGA